jgi:hypothetical protein
VTVTDLVPIAVGVPEITPVLALMEIPAGKLLAAHENGAVPPLASSGVLGYGNPTVPAGSAAGPLTDGGGLKLTEKMRVAVAPAVSVAVIVIENSPDAVGVPEMTPVAALIARPAGRPLADHAYGAVPLDAVTVRLYAIDCSPSGNEPVAIMGTGLIVTA